MNASEDGSCFSLRKAREENENAGEERGESLELNDMERSS